MKVARAAAQRGFILPQRGYPVRNPPQAMNAPEPSLVLGITRQESGFDPLVRSGVGARGMMQLMPSTAVIVARRIGVSYSPGMLDEPDYNMRLGSSYLGQLVGQFSGSYVMAVAGYNAGPGRPTQWSSFCGDPRGGATDPLDFIECIPFSETRNYVMRVMEGMQVYRAKLNGGSVAITLSSDLKRGAYGYPGAIPAVASSEGR
jgi:soluble lytic murein transglycosylase